MAMEIELKILNKQALDAIKSTQDALNNLAKKGGKIEVGDVKQLKALAQAQKEAAKAQSEVTKAIKNTAGAQAQLSKAEKEAQNAATSTIKKNQELLNTETKKLQVAKAEEELAAKRSKTMQEETNAVTAKIRQEKELISKEKEYQNATKATLQAKKAAQQLLTEEARTSKERSNALKAEAQAIAATDKAQKQLNNTMTAGVGIANNMGRAMMNFAKQMIGFYGITQTLRAAFTEMKAMNDELVTYRKVTGATPQEMEAMRVNAYKAAKEYGESPSDFLSSAATMARAGYGQNSAAMAELATKTQLVGDMTSEAASKFLIAVDAAYQYRGSIEQLTTVLDGINEVDNNYATSIEKISEGMTLVASLASSAHVPIEELTAALGTMTAVTQRSGTETARGLRQIFLNIMKDTKTEVEEGVTVAEEEVTEMTKALQTYAPEVIKAAEATGELINPMKAIGALAQKYKEGLLTEQDLFSIVEKIGGKRYYNVFTALIQNWDMYEGMLEKVKNSAGSADKEVAAMMDSWSKKLEKLKATWTELVNNTVSVDFIKGLLDAGTAALEFAGNLENLATMAGGALIAIKALSAGIANLSQPGASMSMSTFGGFNLATSLLGIGVAAIGAWKSAYEKNIKDIQTAAQESVNKAIADLDAKKETIKDLEDITSRYQTLVSSGMANEASGYKELQSLQSQLTSLVGSQAGAIDLVNGAYDTELEKLRALTQEQKEAAKAEFMASRSGAVAAFNQSDLNGFFTTSTKNDNDGYSMANVGIDAYGSKAVQDWIGKSKYLRVWKSLFTNDLYFKKPNNAEEIVAFYKEVTDFYTFLGSTTKDGEKASATMKSMGEEYTQMYTELGKFVNAVKEAAGPVVSWQDALDSLDKALEETKKETESMGDEPKKQVEGQKTAWETLSDAIDAAKKAKEEFDKAMETSKADGMNAYTNAFKTYKEELKSGRVNSTAFHASAKMLLGEEEYAKTGGSSSAIRSRMNRKGKGGNGSINDAWNVLGQTYKDKSGNVIEGYGIYALLQKTTGVKGFNAKTDLVDKNGKAVIPEFTDAQLNTISKQWGGISKNTLINFLNAFDQYNTKGKSDDAKKKADEDAKAKAKAKADAEAKAKAKAEADAQKARDKAQKDSTTAIEKATDAVNKLTDELGGDNGEGEGGEGTEGSGEGGDAQSRLIKEKKENAQELKDLLDDIDVTLTKLGSFTLQFELTSEQQSAFSEILAVTSALSGDDGYTFNFQTGEAFDANSQKVGDLDSALQGIKTLVDAGIIPASLGDDLEKKIKEGVAKGKAYVDKYNEDPLKIDVGADAKKFDEKVDEIQKNKYTGVEIPLDGDVDTDLTTGLALIKSVYDSLNGKTLIFDLSTDTGMADANAQINALESAVSTLSALAKDGKIDYSVAATLAAPLNDVITDIKTGIATYNQDPSKAVIETSCDPTAYVNAMKGLQNPTQPYSAEVEVGADPKAYVGAMKGLTEPNTPYSTDVTVSLEDKVAKKRIADLEKDGYKHVYVITHESTHKETSADGTTYTSTTRSGTRDDGTKWSSHEGTGWASGTQSFHGGPALVNDGAGPELIVNNGRAFIAGGGKPAIVNLSRGAKIFNASQTRDILNNGGIPSFAQGKITYGISTNIDPNNIKIGNDDDKKKKDDKNKNKTNTNSKKKDEKKKTEEKDESFSKLQSIIDYIINRIGTAVSEQIKVIDEQIEQLRKQRELAKKQDELAERQKAVADAQKDLQDAMNNRTVRYLGEDGKWHWQADARNVQSAKEKVESANKSLAEYVDEMIFNDKVSKLEAKKTNLQSGYDSLSKTWSDIVSGANTPTGSITSFLNQVAKKGTKQEKEAAKAIKNVLLPQAKGGNLSLNYKEAVNAVKAATKGNPVMPGDTSTTLASLIAGAGGEKISGSLLATLTTAVAGTKNTSKNASKVTNNNNSKNYYINGVNVGKIAAESKSLSELLKDLTVYAGAS